MGGRGGSSGLGKPPNLEYEAMAYAVTTGHSKYATKEERREATATVSSFIKNMREGDVYQAQGAFDDGQLGMGSEYDRMVRYVRLYVRGG